MPNLGNEATVSGTDVWLTPPHILKALGPFDLDPCASVNRPWDTAIKHFTIEDDGLSQEWIGRVWCNPPYGPPMGKWLQRLAAHAGGVWRSSLPVRKQKLFLIMFGQRLTRFCF